jgi:hypothetical protein
VSKVPTLDQIRAMSAASRRTLYNNAIQLQTPESKAVARLIVEHRLLTTEAGGLPHEDPIVLEMERVISSPEGREAMKSASDAGHPAMAGVDPMLREVLGDDYGKFDTTSWAGTFAAAEMESMGYRQTRKKPMPEGSVAKTAAFFERRGTSEGSAGPIMEDPDGE